MKIRLVTVISLAVVLAACGGSEEGGDTTSTTLDVTTSTTATSTTTGGNESEGTVAQEGDLVMVHYVGTLDDGSQFDSSRDRNQTLDFTVGAGEMITGFDEAVRGMAVGDVKTVRIDPEDAYGPVDEANIVEVGLDQVPEGVQVGDELQDPFTGRAVRVIAVDADSATIDLNHPLAGEALTFEIEMVGIN